MADTVNLVILGASGDLTHRLLLPGLGTLLKAQPKRKVHLVGASADELTQEQWQQRVTESVREGGCSADVVTRLVDGTRYVRIDATSATELTSLLSGLSGPAVLYFALPPAVSMAACEALTTVPLPDDLRLAIEKPFGTDLSTARRFNHLLSELAPEDRVFRVDHFLGKSTVLNLLGLRFTNSFFEPILNRDNVDRIEIIADETLALEGLSSKKAFKTWLEAQTDQFRTRVAIVAMDGFTGFKTAAAEAIPDATAVMDPFHVVALAGDKLNATRQRVQRELTGGRGRADDPLYKARRTLLTGRALLTDKQKARLSALWAIDEAVPVEVTWLTYQEIIDAYRHPDPGVGKKLLTSVIDRIKTAVPAGLDELAQLGRTLDKRRDDILAWFDHPGSSNGPTEAINGRLEHLRGIALGFRNLVNYIAYAEFRISAGMSTSGLC